MAHDPRANLLDMIQAIDRALNLVAGFDEQSYLAAGTLSLVRELRNTEHI